jgi:hypothetical protein
MGFPRGPLRAPAPVRIRVAVFPVGRRVYVACADERPARVALTDEAGTRPLMSLGDGTEVAILAWRPGWAGATRYRVRATDSGLEGWLPVGNLRSTMAAIPAVSTALPPPAVGTAPLRVGEFAESGRRFGQHSHAANVRSSRSIPAPARSAPSASAPESASPQAGGESRDSRRPFGQRSD